ncbi:hypothetical protein AB0M23_07555 [Streptomyces sp. NPDC052077]|uniref:hypothetical protein n=1 Tax=Streptomyces sp. NPDC052077 TaxID=3154757 RepID=UPI0034499232
MPRRLQVARPLLAVLLAAALSPAAGCATGGGAAPRPRPQAPSVPPGPGSPAAAAPSPPALGPDQARDALVTADDLGEPWEPTTGAATWRDGLLKGTAENPDCRRLLDVLYTEELFGPEPPRAAAALDDPVDGGQLHHRIVSGAPADLDRALAWLAGLPETCGRFRATTAHGGALDVRVAALRLPGAGDARQGVRVTVGDDSTVLTVDLAGARVGGDALGLTHGALGPVDGDTTWTAVGTGADRLARARRHGHTSI